MRPARHRYRYARLIADQAQRAAQIADLNRQLTRASWQEYLSEHAAAPAQLHLDLLAIRPQQRQPRSL